MLEFQKSDALFIAYAKFQGLMTQKVREVIYWKGRTGLRLDLVVLLTARGCEIRGVGSFEELNLFRQTITPSLLIVDATGGAAELDSRLVELKDSAALEQTPTLLFGMQAVSRSLSLSWANPNLYPFDVPYSLGNVTEKIEFLLSSTDPQVVQTPVEPRPAVPSKSTDKKSDKHNVVPSEHDLEESIDLGDFEIDSLLAEHPKGSQLQRAFGEIAAMSERVAMQAKQVAQMASNMADRFQLSPERSHNIKTASLCLNWGLTSEFSTHSNLMQSEGVLSARSAADKFSLSHAAACADLSSPEERKLASECFKKSAILIREKLQDELAARTVGLVADLVSQQGGLEDGEALHDAQCTLITELAQRSCWREGDWNPGGAQRFLAGMRTASLMGGLSLDPKIREQMASVISEQISERCNRQSQAKFGNRAQRRGAKQATEVVEALRRAETEFGSAAIAEIDLSKVRAGMKLARPVIAQDGRLILEAGITFNEDLVWRLWELASIRPVWPKLTIVDDDRMLAGHHVRKNSKKAVRAARAN